MKEKMIDRNLDSRFAAWLEENRQRLIADWMELVRIPSVMGEPSPGAPYGKECARALSRAAGMFEERGIPVRINAENGYALAQIGQGEKKICIFGHSDVVPAGDGWLYTEPYEPVIRDGFLIGRGVSDNKSGVIAALYVLEMLRDCQIPIHSCVQAFVGSNEENDMLDAIAFAEKESMPDISLIADATFPCGLGEKGILNMWAKCNRKLTAVREMKGGNAFNIVLDCVEAVLEPNDALALELKNKCTDGTYLLRQKADGIYLTANGMAKHAAAPEGSVNAMYCMAKLLSGCENLPSQDRAIFGDVETFLSSHWGDTLGIAHDDSNFGRLSAVCGMVTMEDGYLKFSIDSRYGTQCDPKELERKLHTCFEGAGWEIVYLYNDPGYLVDENSPIPRLFSDIYAAMSGNDSPCYFMSGGTYARKLKNAFTVGRCTRHRDWKEPTLEMPAGHGGGHQRDECIEMEGFLLAVRILAQYVLACDRLLNE